MSGKAPCTVSDLTSTAESFNPMKETALVNSVFFMRLPLIAYSENKNELALNTRKRHLDGANCASKCQTV